MLSWRKVTSQSVVRASTKWCLSYGLMPKNIPTICNTYAFRFSQAQAFNAPGAIPVVMISPLIIILVLLLHQFVSQKWRQDPPALFKWRVRNPFRIHICCTIAFSDHDDPKMNLSLNLIQRKSAPSNPHSNRITNDLISGISRNHRLKMRQFFSGNYGSKVFPSYDCCKKSAHIPKNDVNLPAMGYLLSLSPANHKRFENAFLPLYRV